MSEPTAEQLFVMAAHRELVEFLRVKPPADILRFVILAIDDLQSLSPELRAHALLIARNAAAVALEKLESK